MHQWNESGLYRYTTQTHTLTWHTHGHTHMDCILFHLFKNYKVPSSDKNLWRGSFYTALYYRQHYICIAKYCIGPSLYCIMAYNLSHICRYFYRLFERAVYSTRILITSYYYCIETNSKILRNQLLKLIYSKPILEGVLL